MPNRRAHLGLSKPQKTINMKNDVKTNLQGCRRKRDDGRAVVWVLVVLALGAAGFFLWQRNRLPKAPPPLVVAAATPLPATPPPATPEPVVVKATPTPAPVVVAATPAPVPTPPPLDLATVARTPALWPPQIKLLQVTTFPVTINGRLAGEAKLPAGTALRLLRVGNQSVEVEYQSARQLIPVGSTDLMQRALLAFRNNGSVLPQPPPVATGPALVQIQATPVRNAALPVRVEVSADRRRVETGGPVFAGDSSAISEKYQYEVKVQNQTFGDVPALDVRYLIFVERQKLGSRKESDTVDRITGSAKVEPLNRKTMAGTVSTSEFVLTKHTIAGDFYYANGGRQKVADNVLGVWVKVFNEGKLVAEYTNPSTVTKRGWDNK
jgi:hypothetical protein